MGGGGSRVAILEGGVLALNVNTSIMFSEEGGREKRKGQKNEAAQKALNVVPRTANIWLFVVKLFLPVQFTQN